MKLLAPFVLIAGALAIAVYLEYVARIRTSHGEAVS